MSKLDDQKRFLTLLGEYYEKFGFLPVFGWIEGTLLLSPRLLSQKEIAATIKKIMGGKQRSASIPSINRALKSLEMYGVVIKGGSFKKGYEYQFNTEIDLVQQMFGTFFEANQGFLQAIIALQKNVKDPDLQKALNIEYGGAMKLDSLLTKFLREINL